MIPREAREALQAKAGDKLLVAVHGDRVITLQKLKRSSLRSRPPARKY